MSDPFAVVQDPFASGSTESMQVPSLSDPMAQSMDVGLLDMLNHASYMGVMDSVHGVTQMAGFKEEEMQAISLLCNLPGQRKSRQAPNIMDKLRGDRTNGSWRTWRRRIFAYLGGDVERQPGPGLGEDPHKRPTGEGILAFLIKLLFERDTLYLISPYDNLAHVGQWMMGLNTTYDFPAAWSFVSLLLMNGVSLYILISRVNSLEVTRE